jgi:hypothetical protein
MAVNSISVTNASVQSTQPGQASAIKQRRQDFEALTQALNSGDLSGAKTAFAAIQQNFKTVTQAQEGQQIGSNTQNKFQSAFQALGQALNSSDLKSAQTAFANLQQARGHQEQQRPPSNSGANAPKANETTVQASNSSISIKA